MKTHLSKRIVALLLTLAMVLSLIPMAVAEEPAKSDDLVVLYTNDVHCGVDQSDSSIGIAGLAKIKKDMEATHNHVALVDSGDAIQGELIGTVSKGEYLVKLMNYVGYDYGTLGNHEFDYTMPQLKKLVDMAEMTYLSCNFQYIGEGEDPDAVDLKGYTVVDYDGLKVAYVGITTPESLVKSTPTYFQDADGNWIYTFCNDETGEKLYNAVQTAVDAARAEGATVVVALAHLGIDEQSAPWRSTDVIANTTGIDVMLDGHSHSTIAKQEVENKEGKTVLLSSTGTKLANVGKLTITREGAVNTELIARADVDGVDADTQTYLEQIEAEFEALKQQVVAHVDYDLLTKDPETGKRMVRMRETNLGNVCADAYRTVLEADIAFVNGGGIRADIPTGDVTYEQIINVHPYSNMACKVKTTGQQILDALEMASRNVTVGEDGSLSGENGGFLQVSGLKYTVNTAIPSSVVVDEAKMFVSVAGPRRVENVQVLQADGSYAPIDPAGTYTLASHNYMLKDCGDGINMFKNDELLLDEVKVDNQVLIEYMTSEAFSAHDYSNWQGEGRISIVKEDMSGKTVILHTNDTHGALMGFAQVAKVKALYESLGATVILVDAGDFSQGTTYVSTNKGEAAVTVMSAAGYDYVTLGNHEFDFGYAQIMANLNKAEGQFVALCADVFEGEESILPAYAIKEVDGLKIGFFGMETPETQTKVNPGLITELTFGTNGNGKFLSSAQDAVAALKEAGADLIIGLVHLGVDDESEPYRSIDLYDEIKDDVDFLIDGHSHTVMTEGPNGEPIQSTGTKASKTALMNVGMIVIDNATKKIESNTLIPLGDDAPVDETVAAVAQEIMDAVDAEYGAKFAVSEVELNGDKAPGNRNMETNLGDLITDSMVWGVLKDMDAETLGVPAENVVAITNGGGIRAWIHAGDVTKNDVNTVLPFGNTVSVVYVTGAELLEALEASTYSTPGAVGGFPQVSGMKINIDTTKEFDQGEQYPASTYYKPASIRRVTIEEVNGQKFSKKATYAVITNNFCAAGGDTYYAFKAASKQFDTGIPLDEMLIDYVNTELHGVIGETYAEPQGRITQEFRFTDVKDPSKYYFNTVYWAYNHEPRLVGGTGDGTTFSPNGVCTRAEVVTFLYAAAGSPEVEATENPFTDVKAKDWFYKAALWAVENNITGGTTATTFSPKGECTRAEVVTFLYAVAKNPAPTSTENKFTDVKEKDWFYNAVLWAVENGVTGGTTATTFSPKKTCTRAEIVTFLCAFLTKQEGQVEPFAITFPSTSNDDIAKYGNVYTDCEAQTFFDQGYTWGDVVTVKFLNVELELPVVPTFSYVDQGTAGVFVNKDAETGAPTGRVFLAINMGDFATTYGLATKTTNEDKTYFWTAVEGVEFPVPVSITMKEAGGYAAEMMIRDINRTNNREDYPELSNAEFANFRQITTTGMGEQLYRGSSPINPEIGRNTYADAALADAKATVIMNLANDQATAEAYEGFADTYYSKQNVIYLNLGVDFQAADFQAGLANGLRFFAQNEGVYYVHCTEGKDRAGFVSALLECLMGASFEEVVADYLKTYQNYYTVVDGKQQPLSQETLDAIANSNIIKTLQTAFGVEDLKTADLAAEAEGYLTEIGLTAEEIAALKLNLGPKAVTEPINFEFLVTSDLHGQIYATDYTQPYEKSGTYSRGLTRVATYIKEQKAIYGDNVYTVDMGDTFQGAPLTYYYAFNKPEVKDPAILAFRTIGYDMWLVGNHEFNYGLEILNRQMSYAVSEGDENEQQLTICMANYLDAATNNDETKDWATWKGYAPYVIKDFDGYKVAVIGFGNPNIPQWDVPANWEGIYFANIIDTYKHYEAEMLEQADMIVVVAHSGTDSDPNSDFMKQLVEETNTIAFAFSGHEHKNTITKVTNADGKEISILSPYTKARRIAQVKVTVDGEDVTITPSLENMENYPIDESLAELLKPYETDTWENYMLQPIGKALGDYPAKDLGTAPSAFMDLINTVQIWGAYDRTGNNTPDKTEDDKPAMLSISAPLTSGDKENLISEGDIYLGDMFGLYRFENWFYQITMSGEEVHQWLEFAATKIQVDAEGKPYVTNGDLTYYDVIMGEGFHYDIDVSKPEGERVINMRYNGEAVAADQEFTVVVNNYRYNGGGNYVNWLNEHGCEFVANDPNRIIYSTQFDMIQGEDEGQARALLVSYIKDQTAQNGGITPFVSSDWTVQNGYVAPEDPVYRIATSLPEDGKQYVFVARGTDNKFYALDNYETNSQVTTATVLNIDPETMTIAEVPDTVLYDAVVSEGKTQFKVGSNYLHLNASKIRVTNGTSNSYMTFTAVEGKPNQYTMHADNDSYLTFDGTTFKASNSGNGTIAEIYLFTLS